VRFVRSAIELRAGQEHRSHRGEAVQRIAPRRLGIVHDSSFMTATYAVVFRSFVTFCRMEPPATFALRTWAVAAG
jgi:hypothetical protein